MPPKSILPTRIKGSSPVMLVILPGIARHMTDKPTLSIGVRQPPDPGKFRHHWEARADANRAGNQLAGAVRRLARSGNDFESNLLRASRVPDRPFAPRQ